MVFIMVFTTLSTTVSRIWLVGCVMAALLLLAACQPIELPAPEMTSAFVRNHTLYIQQGQTVTEIEACASGCHLYYLTWSADGERLAYFYSPARAEEPFEIRVADRTGAVRTVAEGVGWITPPAWSPDGEQVAYFVATDRYVVEAGTPRYVLEVWTSELTANAVTPPAQLRGEVSIGGDCGGGGRSESALLYEVEGGLAYGGYLAGVLAWTAGDLLLYTNHCSAHGVGRFDLATGVALEPYPGKLSSLSLNRMRDGWVAVDEQQRLVLGTPTELHYAPLPTEATPELAFYGQATDELFYTVMTSTGTADLFDSSLAQPSIAISPYFEFTQPELRRIRHATEQRLLWNQDAYAYARIQQSIDGTLYFTQVRNSLALYEAMIEGTLTAESVEGLRPTVDVLRLTPGSDTPELWMANASQYSIAPSPSP